MYTTVPVAGPAAWATVIAHVATPVVSSVQAEHLWVPRLIVSCWSPRGAASLLKARPDSVTLLPFTTTVGPV